MTDDSNEVPDADDVSIPSSVDRTDTPTDTCVRCGERPPVAGRLARRCEACLTEMFGTDDDARDATIIEHHTPDGRGYKHEYVPQSDGSYHYTEYVLTEGGGWRPIGSEQVAALTVTRPD